MSKLTCQCGAVLSNTASSCATEGFLIGQARLNELRTRLSERVAEFIAAGSEHREHWIEMAFGNDYPSDLSDAKVIDDLLSLNERGYFSSVAECPECGRIHVQVAPGINQYRSFVPDDSGYHQLLVQRPNGH